MKEQAFGDLRRLADWLAAPSPIAPLWLSRLLARLGRTAVPILARALRSDDLARREAARHALAMLAETERPRVIAELRAVADDPTACDDAKVCAVGLLGELGERGEARFSDPRAIRERSALALAAQLE